MTIRTGIAQTQRLIVPGLADVEADVFGNISLPAYCADATRVWPAYDANLSHIYFGAGSTIVTLSINESLKTISLQEALNKGYLEIVSSEAAINVVPAKPGITLKKLSTKGFAAGEQAEVRSLDQSLVSLLPPQKETDAYQYQETQHQLHKEVSKRDNSNAALKSERINEFMTNWIERDGNELRSENWTVSKENNTIKIHEKTIDEPDPFGETPFENLMEYLSDEFDDELSFCITIDPDDSTLTINIKGAIKGEIPVEIAFSSDNEFVISAELANEELHTGNAGNLPAFTISRAVDFSAFGENEEDGYHQCALHYEGELCFPFERSSISVEACGKTMSVGVEEINFAF